MRTPRPQLCARQGRTRSSTCACCSWLPAASCASCGRLGAPHAHSANTQSPRCCCFLAGRESEWMRARTGSICQSCNAPLGPASRRFCCACCAWAEAQHTPDEGFAAASTLERARGVEHTIETSKQALGRAFRTCIQHTPVLAAPRARFFLPSPFACRNTTRPPPLSGQARTRGLAKLWSTRD